MAKKLSNEKLLALAQKTKEENASKLYNFGRDETSNVGATSVLSSWGKKWTVEEDNTIRAMTKAGKPINEMMVTLKRSYVAIWKRRQVLGISGHMNGKARIVAKPIDEKTQAKIATFRAAMVLAKKATWNDDKAQAHAGAYQKVYNPDSVKPTPKKQSKKSKKQQPNKI